MMKPEQKTAEKLGQVLLLVVVVVVVVYVDVEEVADFFFTHRT